MAQHDYVIDNSTGANVRTDINNVLQAIASNNSGSSAPSTTYATQFFADTNDSILKLRNTANSGYVNLFTLAGGVDVDAASSFNEDVTFHGVTSGRNIVFDKSSNALRANDNASVKFGTDGDADIFHDGSDLFIREIDSGQILFRSDGQQVFTNQAGSENRILTVNNGTVKLYFDHGIKFETLSSGVQITGQEFISEGTVYLEKSGAHHHRILANDTGNDLGFQQSSDTGANTNFTTYLRINDGGDISLPVDNQKLRIGASGDLELLHDGTDCLVRMEGGTGGDLIIQTGASDDDVFIKCNDDFIVNVQGGAENAIIARNSAETELYFDATERAATVSNGFTVKNKLFLARETGTTADYANFRIAFYQSIPADSSHTFQVGSVHAMGTVQIFGSRGASANNATLATGRIFPIHVRASATAGLGSQIGSDLGGASGGFSYSVAAASQGITITNGSSSFAMNTFVSFDLTGFVG